MKNSSIFWGKYPIYGLEISLKKLTVRALTLSTIETTLGQLPVCSCLAAFCSESSFYSIGYDKVEGEGEAEGS